MTWCRSVLRESNKTLAQTNDSNNQRGTKTIPELDSNAH